MQVGKNAQIIEIFEPGEMRFRLDFLTIFPINMVESLQIDRGNY